MRDLLSLKVNGNVQNNQDEITVSRSTLKKLLDAIDAQVDVIYRDEQIHFGDVIEFADMLKLEVFLEDKRKAAIPTRPASRIDDQSFKFPFMD